MPTLYALKPAFRARLRPLADRLARAGVTANQITFLAAALSIAKGLVVARLLAIQRFSFHTVRYFWT
ncbi:conserved hypothetical protein [Mesorhizobium metallidurans STM 2683]|uniref:Uncharacterized protein n=1 Tax=Mesorhizobium metallidurans STM 2683 TaxID=1297569 RepID=M5EVV4_9HYPH|nr:hypothetical protein [Mesorhizobium metallidurans]CCV08140.1 conserved hypothetical protein [Mesorhizobium metallidurans STM 2683]